jgi:hypothetical protein
MSRDIVDISTPSDRLVVAAGIEGEPADQLACVGVEDSDVAVGDEELDRPPLVGPADADVVELAVVAQSDGALRVDLVVADAERDLVTPRSFCPSRTMSGSWSRPQAQRPAGSKSG